LAVLLLYNSPFAATHMNCCGWQINGGTGEHHETSAGGTYAWAVYNGGIQDSTNKGYCGFDQNNNPITCRWQDVASLSDELGEWADDPYSGTPAPCAFNGLPLLEVADPIDGGTSNYHIVYGANNNYPYHLEDLVFLPFFGATSPMWAYNNQATFFNLKENYCGTS
jgi:hypothetical protein